jgi:hypothetical protein
MLEETLSSLLAPVSVPTPLSPCAPVRALSLSSWLTGSSGTPACGGRFSPMLFTTASAAFAPAPLEQQQQQQQQEPATRSISFSDFDFLASTSSAVDFFSDPTLFATAAAHTHMSPCAALVPAMGADAAEQACDTVPFSQAAPHDIAGALHPAMFAEEPFVEGDSLPLLSLFNSSSAASSPGSVLTSGVAESKRKRRPKVAVAEEIKATLAYQERRRKNNLAAARNREMKRMEARAEIDRLPALDARKQELQDECALLRNELAALKTRLAQRLAVMC